MFSVESLGEREQEEFSNYDEQIIELFRRSISFNDNKNYVQLPWDSDKISFVSPNDSYAYWTVCRGDWNVICFIRTIRRGYR